MHNVHAFRSCRVFPQRAAGLQRLIKKSRSEPHIRVLAALYIGGNYPPIEEGVPIVLTRPLIKREREWARSEQTFVVSQARMEALTTWRGCCISRASYHEHGRRGTKTAVRNIAATFHGGHAANDGLKNRERGTRAGGEGGDEEHIFPHPRVAETRIQRFLHVDVFDK